MKQMNLKKYYIQIILYILRNTQQRNAIVAMAEGSVDKRSNWRKLQAEKTL